MLRREVAALVNRRMDGLCSSRNSWTKLKEKINECEGKDRMAGRTRGEREERKEARVEGKSSSVGFVNEIGFVVMGQSIKH
jgi:hypothetical protein